MASEGGVTRIKDLLIRRLEQVLHVHPEKYSSQPTHRFCRESRSIRTSRQNTPPVGLCGNVTSSSHKLATPIVNNNTTRSKSYDFATATCDIDEPNGLLLTRRGSTASRRVTSDLSPQRGTPASDSDKGNNDLITINVSGLRFQTFERTLRRYPDTLLGNHLKRERYYNKDTKEYFFDRHRSSFEAILYIYQSGGLIKRPDYVPLEFFLSELRFYQMGEELIEMFWISEGYDKPEVPPMPVHPLQRRIWELMEFPDSSLAARIVALISVSVIIISIASFCLETLPPAEEEPPAVENETLHAGKEVSDPPKNWNLFFWLESACIIWFTVEFLLRFFSCPSKKVFMKTMMNVIDVVAIAPFFINLFWEFKSSAGVNFAVLRVLRLVRVFRIFKLSRHSVGLQILAKTFQASLRELGLLIFFMMIALVLFASGMYFAEQGEPNTKFTSIPASFWFVLVTMTTVGYGDLVPTGLYGKLVGSMCALIGVLTLALPVPIIVGNFKVFYRQETKLAAMVSAGKVREQEYADFNEDDA